jgi:hypothetical protein
MADHESLGGAPDIIASENEEVNIPPQENWLDYNANIWAKSINSSGTRLTGCNLATPPNEFQ